MKSESRAGIWAPLLIVTAIGGVLRLVHLDSGMWYDELFGLLNYVTQSFLEIMKNPYCHPFYTMLEKVSVGLFGESSWSARLPAFIMGIATIPLLYYFAFRVSSGITAICASLLLVFSMRHVWFSQGARGYSGMILFCLASQYFFIEMIDRPKLIMAAGYVLSMAAASFMMPFCIFTLVAHAMIIVALDRFKFKANNRILLAAIILSVVATGLLYLPSAMQMLKMAGGEGRETEGMAFGFRYILLMLADLAGWKSRPLFGVALFCFALTGVAAAWKKRPLIVIMAFLPLVLAFIVTAAGKIMTYYRYVSFFMPWYFLFAGWGITAIGRLSGKWKIPVITASMVLLAAFDAKPLYDYYKLGKQPLKKVAKWAEKLPPEYPVYSFGLTDSEFKYYSSRAILVPSNQTITDLLPGGGVFISAFPWSWDRKDALYLQTMCRGFVWPAATYKINDVYIFICPAQTDAAPL